MPHVTVPCRLGREDISVRGHEGLLIVGGEVPAPARRAPCSPASLINNYCTLVATKKAQAAPTSAAATCNHAHNCLLPLPGQAAFGKYQNAKIR